MYEVRSPKLPPPAHKSQSPPFAASPPTRSYGLRSCPYPMTNTTAPVALAHLSRTSGIMTRAAMIRVPYLRGSSSLGRPKVFATAYPAYTCNVPTTTRAYTRITLSSLRPHAEGITPSRGHMPARVVRISYDEKASRMGWLERGGADARRSCGARNSARPQTAARKQLPTRAVQAAHRRGFGRSTAACSPAGAPS